MKVTMDRITATNPRADNQRTGGDSAAGEVPMSYAEAKEIALLRMELRTCWDAGDRTGAELALSRLWQVVGTDSELTAEARRWAVKFS